MGTPVVIDDVAASAQHLSELGRAVIRPAVEAVRTAIRNAASSRGWRIIEYDQYAEWVADQWGDLGQSVVLDPLLCMDRQARSVRVSRVLQGDKWELAADIESLREMPASVVSVVDDVVASGATLTYVVDELRKHSVTVSTVVVCCASAFAREIVAKVSSRLTWRLFVEEPAATIHLRDACPYLPFSGRPHAGLPVLATPNGAIAVRVPSLARKAGMWPQLFADYRVLAACLYARSEVAGRLSSMLGRAATVGDLPVLGRDVPLPAFPRHQLSATTELASIC